MADSGFSDYDHKLAELRGELQGVFREHAFEVKINQDWSDIYNLSAIVLGGTVHYSNRSPVDVSLDGVMGNVEGVESYTLTIGKRQFFIGSYSLYIGGNISNKIEDIGKVQSILGGVAWKVIADSERQIQ